MPEDLSRCCFQDVGCADHGKRGFGNLTVCGRYGKQKQHRLLDCRSCKARFSERKGTPLVGSRLTDVNAVSIFEPLAERNGVEATACEVGAQPNTVVRDSRLVEDPECRLDLAVVPVATRTQHPPCSGSRIRVYRIRPQAGV